MATFSTARPLALVAAAAAICSPALVEAHAHEHAFLLDSLPNPAALGFEPVPLDVHYDDVPLQVEGTVPSYLNGSLYRGAPGSWPDGWWLDGLMTLHAFKFREGRVLYTMKWSKDEVYNRTVARTEPAPVLDRAPVPGGIPHLPNSSWQTGVSFKQVQGHIMGTTGVSNSNCFDFESLEPVEMPFEYSDDLGAPYLAPTHEHMIDGWVVHHLVTGMQQRSGGAPGYVVYTIKPGTRHRDVVARIERPREASPVEGYPSYQHMALATKDYYIMLEAPCYYPDSTGPVGQVNWKGWRSNLAAKGHVRVVSRVTGESIVYPLTSTVFSIHHINAFHDEATNSLVVDTVQTLPSIVPCSFAFKSLSMDNYINGWQTVAKALSLSKMVRITLPLDKPGALVKPVALTNISGAEFPTIRYDDLNGKPYQFVYACWMMSKSSPYYDALIKVDISSGGMKVWHKDGHYPGEPIFVPNPEGATEDDGVVMTNVLDVAKGQTYVLLLDARTWTPVARAGPTPHVVPHGFHGRYYDRKLNAAPATEEGTQVWV